MSIKPPPNFYCTKCYGVIRRLSIRDQHLWCWLKFWDIPERRPVNYNHQTHKKDTHE